MFWRTTLFVYFSLVISAISGYLLVTTCDFNVKIRQNLLNNGFHRNLTYGIVFNPESERDKWLYKDCIVGLEQPLPRGVFANPDELGDLTRNQKLNAVVKNKVNIEMPAEDSEPSSVYLSGKVRGDKVYLWLPLHARYHRAKAGGGKVSNEIPPPTLYLRCPDQRLDTCEKQVLPAVSFLCNGSSKEKCSWKQIPYTMMTDKIIWETPVGDTDDYYIVVSGTLLTTILGSLYIIYKIHEYKLRENKKIVYKKVS